MNSSVLNKALIGISTLGIIAACILALIAIQIYPGGSTFDPNATEFSWLHNYWCDLMMGFEDGSITTNSQLLAKVSWLVLCLSLVPFCWILPQLFVKQKPIHRIIQLSGIAAALIWIFLFTSYHDFVIYIGGILGTIAGLALFLELKKARENRFLGLLIACFFLGVINYFIFIASIGLLLLPFLQKLPLFGFIIFVMLINFKIFQKNAV